MKELARTPIIAALLCSLYSVKAEMPSTEIELYEQRLDLLLGKWDRAKVIASLAHGTQSQYRHFLMSFAIHMHHSERRTATLDEAYPFLRRYQVRKIHETPIALLEDYIRRGIIEKEPDGKYTFGHLTHQKFLAALWLCEKNPVDFIWSKLKSPWWAKVQEFYAAKKLDITDLVRFGSKFKRNSEILGRIFTITKLAPLTSEEAMKIFMRDAVGLPEYSGRAKTVRL